MKYCHFRKMFFQQNRKALRAAIVLIPLLGITNLIWLVPLPCPTAKKVNIILFNVVLLFLDSFQGFVVATVYCFLNQEVMQFKQN